MKVVKPGMDSTEVLARFNAERRALALMNHPGIAKILDAGQTAAGRPLLVKDVVESSPVHEYCRTFQLTIKDRIRLFCDICRAVHLAHQKGIIDRNLTLIRHLDEKGKNRLNALRPADMMKGFLLSPSGLVYMADPHPIKPRHENTPSRGPFDSTQMRYGPAELVVSKDKPSPSSDQSASAVATRHTEQNPPSIGRYHVRCLLGEGGFGRVFEAYDEQLQRTVAIKVPHSRLVSTRGNAEPYLTEARTVASLDHPHIVPVYDVGSSDGFPCFVVSKYIDGPSLAQMMTCQTISRETAVEVVATVADALHYAHLKGLVHRDVKPGNILLGSNQHPYVADFGLALREDHDGEGPQFAGTPAYMSPEQARGEGHRVDRRSDIFSLGVVLYALLSGRLPFEAETSQELLKQISEREPVPLVHIDTTISPELDRICSKALSKHVSERYATAHEFAEDLQCWLTDLRRFDSSEPRPHSILATTGELRVGDNGAINLAQASQHRLQADLVQVVPKGLRSFDAHDASFFLELLPGPRDRHGLPDSIRFWKSRIEERDPEQTFAIGLLYGPSGCGKTSLVRAGLLPRLSADVVPIYVEATPAEAEERLLKRLQLQFASLDPKLNLREAMTAIRQGNILPAEKKIVIVLDQFEQWLHATQHFERSALVQALRQCDGGRLQSIVMVRDDFWMAATRFMRELDLRILEGQNSASVDLFSLRHAERVLKSFGRAFGAISDNETSTVNEASAFIRQAVGGLAENDHVVCVRLTLFAEMMKDRPWTVRSLKALGGPHGVGVRFLEESFSEAKAAPVHRYHQRAARQVLQALLPQAGSNIKGEMKSYKQLLEISGYAGREKEFQRLIHMLDIELRLISPADRNDTESEDVDSDTLKPGETWDDRFYQLTHDYLVPSLREWLTLKQKETRRGRAELLLSDRASLWESKPESRNLPWTREWLLIRLLTDKSKWTNPQRRMMEAASRVNRRFWGITATICLVAMILGYAAWSRVEAKAQRQNARTMVSSLETALSSEIPTLLNDLERLPKSIVVDELESRFARSSGHQRLRLAYGLARFDHFELTAIIEAIMDPETPSTEAAHIVDAMQGFEELSLSRLKEAAAVASEQREYATKARIALTSLYLGDNSLALEILTRGPQRNSETAHELPQLRQDFLNQVESLPIFPTIKRDPAEMQLIRARALFYLDRFGEALDTLEHLASGSDVDPMVLSLQTVCLARAGRSSDLQQVKDRLGSPTYGDHFYAYASIVSDAYQGKLTQAEAAVRSFVEIERDDPLRLYHAARISAQLARVYEHSDPAEATNCRQLSLELLRQAYDALGDNNFPRADIEPDFMPLHQEPDFQSFVMKLFPPAPLFDPQQRTRLIKVFQEWPCDLTKLANLMDDVEDPALQSGIALAIGGIEKPSLETKSAWSDLLDRWCYEATDAGTSNAARWVLQRWNLPVSKTHDSLELPHDRNWWRSNELSMVRIPAGSVNTGAGTIFVRDDFWIGDHEITLGVFEHFVQACAPELRPLDWEGCRVFGTRDEHRFPAQRLSWCDAILFCNWLSLEHDLNPCYKVQRDGDTLDVELIPDADGYRLPTEEEWEYACRAGSSTQFSFGDHEGDLEDYAWIDIDSEFRPHEVGTKRCNSWGLFDMHGNVWEWCWRDSPQLDRIARGGAWSDWFGRCSSSFRLLKDSTTYRASGIGFRVVRASAN